MSWLVREEGRDVSSQYGRGGGGAGWQAALRTTAGSRDTLGRPFA